MKKISLNGKRLSREWIIKIRKIILVFMAVVQRELLLKMECL